MMQAPGSPGPVSIIGLDPGLRHTGWGIIRQDGTHLSFVACGRIDSTATLAMAVRLRQLHEGLLAVFGAHRPDEAAVEETFVNRDPQSALKLGQARGIALLAPALMDCPVAEYAANVVKKTVVGAGHADKDQVAMMVKVLLPKVTASSADAIDALAVAITHAQHRASRQRLARLA